MNKLNGFAGLVVGSLLFVSGLPTARADEEAAPTCHICRGYPGPGGVCYAGPGGPQYAGPGGPRYAGPGGPLYAGPGGDCYAGPGGPCYSGPGGPGTCPAECD